MTQTMKARFVSRYATYKGDVTHMAKERQVVGPNTMGEFLTALTAHYDAEKDITRVGFGYGVDSDD